MHANRQHAHRRRREIALNGGLLKLNDDLLLYIFSFLTPVALDQLSQISRGYRGPVWSVAAMARRELRKRRKGMVTRNVFVPILRRLDNARMEGVTARLSVDNTFEDQCLRMAKQLGRVPFCRHVLMRRKHSDALSWRELYRAQPCAKLVDRNAPCRYEVKVIGYTPPKPLDTRRPLSEQGPVGLLKQAYGETVLRVLGPSWLVYDRAGHLPRWPCRMRCGSELDTSLNAYYFLSSKVCNTPDYIQARFVLKDGKLAWRNVLLRIDPLMRLGKLCNELAGRSYLPDEPFFSSAYDWSLKRDSYWTHNSRVKDDSVMTTVRTETLFSGCKWCVNNKEFGTETVQSVRERVECEGGKVVSGWEIVGRLFYLCGSDYNRFKDFMHTALDHYHRLPGCFMSIDDIKYEGDSLGLFFLVALTLAGDPDFLGAQLEPKDFSTPSPEIYTDVVKPFEASPEALRTPDQFNCFFEY